MAKKLADFHKKLKDLCAQHDVWFQSIKVEPERLNKVKFVKYKLSAKDDEQEGEQILTEISKFSS